jgi:hypothetical protein|tara:strand:- start:1168 stop:1566 length:399 start_codon:yes stop_codon:yes gene_type:complete
MSSLQTIRQTPTPLNTLYFSGFNAAVVNRGIREKFRQISGIAIDYQREEDVFALMRTVFINNAGNHHENVRTQVRAMNAQVVDLAVKQVKSGVMQHIEYLRTIDSPLQPLAQPVNTSTVGKKIPYSKQVGIN